MVVLCGTLLVVFFVCVWNLQCGRFLQRTPVFDRGAPDFGSSGTCPVAGLQCGKTFW